MGKFSTEKILYKFFSVIAKLHKFSQAIEDETVKFLTIRSYGLFCGNGVSLFRLIHLKYFKITVPSNHHHSYFLMCMHSATVKKVQLRRIWKGLLQRTLYLLYVWSRYNENSIEFVEKLFSGQLEMDT